MSELIGLAKIATQMKETVMGKTVENIIPTQVKALNASVEAYANRTKGAKVTNVYSDGRWLVVALDNNEHLLLSFDLGSDIFYFENNAIKKQKHKHKHNIEVRFTDQSGYTVRFWWFEKFWLANQKELEEITKAKDSMVDPLDEAFSFDYFKSMLSGKKTQIKSFLMSQKQVRGLSGMYLHDILWQAGLHPQTKISDLTESDIQNLHESMLTNLRNYRKKMDFLDDDSDFGIEDFLIAYKENDKRCPTCSEVIAYIKTGSTSTYICPTCQAL